MVTVTRARGGLDIARYNKTIRELHQELKECVEYWEDNSLEGLASEVAPGILNDEPWIADVLIASGVHDVEGRFIDDIYTGRGL